MKEKPGLKCSDENLGVKVTNLLETWSFYQSKQTNKQKTNKQTNKKNKQTRILPSEMFPPHCIPI